MYTFINTQLRKEAVTLIKNGWEPREGKIGGASIEFDEDCSSFLYNGNVTNRDNDMTELKKMFNKK